MPKPIILQAGPYPEWDQTPLDPRFLDLPNVLLQPHHASGTIETRKAMGQLMRDNLTAHFAGRPILTPVV